MLYYIVPPIIIIVSLAFLITFLFRKFSIDGNVKTELLEGLGDKNSKKSSFFSSIWFKVLEFFTKKIKLFSLRLHNISNNWFQSIKNKKISEVSIEKESVPVMNIKAGDERKNNKITKQEEDREDIFIRRNNKIFTGRKSKLEDLSSKKKIAKDTIANKEEELIISKPIEKNKLEDALIKRIAMNPKDIEAYERLGDYYSDIKNFKDSVECYKQVIKLSPRHLKAKIKLKSLERILKR